MTDQEKVQAATDEAAEDARDNRAHKILLALGISGFLGVLLLAAVLVLQNSHINDQGAQITTLRADGNVVASQAQQLAQQVRNMGGTPVVEPASPGPQGLQGAQGMQGPGPTDEQIDAAVTRILAAHPPAPGQNATPAMVATAVAEFLTANPPAPGRAPTQQEIETAASTYIAAHAADFQGATGQSGTNGTNGKDATDAQVAAAVGAYCDAHNNCAGATGTTGADGATGPQGVSVTDVAFARDSSGACQVVVTLHDPATGTDTTVTHSAGDAACPLLTTNATKATR